MRRALPRAVAVVCLVGLIACASAVALQIRIGKTVVEAQAHFAPRTLPQHGNAPVTIRSEVKIGNSDGSAPPTLRTITFVFDKHGAIDTKDLPTCTLAKLAETTTAAAKARCGGAIVGEGVGRAIVDLPGQPQQQISSPILLFNGPPEGGRPTLIAHAYETVPAPKALLVPFAIERIHKGRFGYRVQIQMPEIAGGFGAATLATSTLGHTWQSGGRSHSFVSARCEGGRLQIYGTLDFEDGSHFPGTLIQPCRVAG